MCSSKTLNTATDTLNSATDALTAGMKTLNSATQTLNPGYKTKNIRSGSYVSSICYSPLLKAVPENHDILHIM